MNLRVNHGMTHSVYINDPNGYGVEVLYELPREMWAERHRRRAQLRRGSAGRSTPRGRHELHVGVQVVVSAECAVEGRRHVAMVADGKHLAVADAAEVRRQSASCSPSVSSSTSSRGNRAATRRGSGPALWTASDSRMPAAPPGPGPAQLAEADGQREVDVGEPLGRDAQQAVEDLASRHRPAAPAASPARRPSRRRRRPARRRRGRGPAPPRWRRRCAPSRPASTPTRRPSARPPGGRASAPAR